MELSVKAYGKILVFGSYSILEPGNIGLVVNIDKGTTATVQETEPGRVIIDLANFKITVYGVMKGDKLVLEKDNETVKYIKNAIDYTFKYLNYKQVQIKDVKIVSYNDPELYFHKKHKPGFGSSATSIVSTVAAILNLHGIDDRDLVYKISYYSHYKSQNNLGSGFDISSACYGSQFFISSNINLDDEFIKCIESEWEILRKDFDWPDYLIPVIIYTGHSASTAELVKKVLNFRNKNLAKYSDFIKEYNNVNLAIKNAIEEKWIKRIKHFLDISWDMRKQLGKMAGASIESAPMTMLLNHMEKNGAFAAGLTGAGGGDSIIALCLSKEEEQKLIKHCEKKKLTVLDNIKIVNKGYHLI